MVKRNIMLLIYLLICMFLLVGLCEELSVPFFLGTIIAFIMSAIVWFLPLPISMIVFTISFLVIFFVKGIHYITLGSFGLYIVFTIIFYLIMKKDSKYKSNTTENPNKIIVSPQQLRRIKNEFFKYTYHSSLEYRQILGVTTNTPTKKEAREYSDSVCDLLINDHSAENINNYKRKGGFNPYDNLELMDVNGIFMDMIEYFIYGNNSKDNRCEQMDEGMKNRLRINLWSICRILLGDDEFDKEIHNSIERVKNME